MTTVIKSLDVAIAFLGKYPMIPLTVSYYLGYKLIRETIEKRLLR